MSLLSEIKKKVDSNIEPTFFIYIDKETLKIVLVTEAHITGKDSDLDYLLSWAQHRCILVQINEGAYLKIKELLHDGK